MEKIILSSKYKPLFTSTSRYYIITGGRGSSKSFSVTAYLVMLMLAESGHTILFTRFTMTSAHLSIIPEFLEKIELLGVVDKFNITKESIECKLTGSKIIFKGIRTSTGDNSANLKSLNGVTTWVMDESEELTNEETFDKINLSVRSKERPNKIILILNPSTKEHWIYQRFFQNNGVEPGSNTEKNNVCYTHTTYEDNLKNLEPSFLSEVQNIKETNPHKYQTTILGGWLDKAEGVVFTNWTLGDFNPDNLQVIYGQDYGFVIDPTSLIAVAIDSNQKKIYLKELLYEKGLTTTQIYEANNKHAANNLIVGDSAEPRLISELQVKGNNIVPAIKGPGSINAGVSIMQDHQLIIDSESTNLVKELNHYVYVNKASQLYIDKYNHALDAARMAVFYLKNAGTGTYYF